MLCSVSLLCDSCGELKCAFTRLLLPIQTGHVETEVLQNKDSRS